MRLPRPRDFVSLGRSIGSAASRFFTGGPIIASKELQAQRLGICEGCPHSIFTSTTFGYQCNLCACLCKLKVSLVAEKCPDNPSRW